MATVPPGRATFRVDFASLRTHFLAGLIAIVAVGSSFAAGLPKVPEGFDVRLVATVPAVLYPSQVATAPGGLLFVAEDPMDQPGPTNQPLDRIVLFREGQEPVVFAEKLNAIFGMAWREGTLYVMNMPNLTLLRDDDGDGKAEFRRELFTDLGVPAGSPNNLNDHIVSGIQFGIDGRLYISVGDKGVPKATGPDRRTVQLKGGGTLRCNPDGTMLEVYSNGSRNHLEANLDDRDNLFTYDNTDDGDGWWTRVTHHIDGGYYGYPYDYHDRPDRFLNRMAEFGGGSPCGAIFYEEDAWPVEYRGMGIWSEWGKRKVTAFRFKPKGATFEIEKMIDLAEAGDSGEFHPIDVALTYDGKTLYVADWGMGGWGKKDEKVGRIYALTPKTLAATRPRGADSDSLEAQIKQLDHPSRNERTRAQLAIIRQGEKAIGPVVAALSNPATNPLAARHLIWTLDALAGGTPRADDVLIKMFSSHTPDLRAQSVRALGIRKIASAAPAIRKLINDPDPTVRLQALIALGRIGDRGSVASIVPVLTDEDPYLAFSARQALRRIGDWKQTATIFSKTRDAKLRLAILAVLDLVYDVDAAAILAKDVEDAQSVSTNERAKAIGYLASIHRTTHPWDGKWWGTRPTQGKPPAKDVDWKGTTLVLNTLRKAVGDGQVRVRLAAIDGIVEAGDRKAIPTLEKRYQSERDATVKIRLALAFGDLGDTSATRLLTATLRDPTSPEGLRDAVLTSLSKLGGDVAVKALIELLNDRKISDQSLPKVMSAVGKLKAEAAVKPLIARLKSKNPAIRAAAIEALGAFSKHKEIASALVPSLDDPDLSVRKAAIAALGNLGDRSAISRLIAASNVSETSFEASIALTKIPDVQALPIYLRGVADRSPELRRGSFGAIAAIRGEAAPILDQLAARHELPPKIIPDLRRIFTGVHAIRVWKIIGPLAESSATAVPADRPVDLAAKLPGLKGDLVEWREAKAINFQGEINLGKLFSEDSGQIAFGYAEVVSPSARKARMIVGSDDTLTIWVNGKQVYDFNQNRSFRHDENEFEVDLASGVNRVLIRCGNHGGGWQFAAAVSEPTDYAFLKAPAANEFNPDSYRDFAIKTKGNAEHGKALFSDLKGLACLKCHAVGTQGGKVGPELSSVGVKYPREELISSVLYPSAKISSGYEPVIIATTDGRVITGIVKSDQGGKIELDDVEAKRITINKDEVDERKPSNVSLMPNGLAEGISREDFADLIAYLESLRENPSAAIKQGGGK
jgi:putative heme-binding domain-containing protein